MRNIHPLVLIFFSLVFTHSTKAQNLNQGLIAYYCLNGDAVDVATTKNGTLMNGAIGVADRANNINGAVHLDGVDDYIKLPSDVWITGDFSWSGWIKPYTIGSWPHLWGFGNGTNAENVFFSLAQGFNNMPHFTTHDCSTGNSYYRVPVSSTLPTNQWVHLAVTLSGNTVTIYKDNVVWTSGATTILPCAAVKDTAFIGRSNFTFNSNAYVHADLDDFRFYDRVLTPNEITQLYELEATNDCAPNSIKDTKRQIRELKIIPNPANVNFKIETPQQLAVENMKIFDALGRQIQFEQITSNIISLGNNISPGIYHMRGILNDESRFSARIVLR